VPFVDGPVGYKVPGELRAMISVMSLRPKNLEGNARLAAHQADDDARLRAAGSLGSRPLVVLTSSQLLASQPRWGEGQRQLAALSTDSTAIVAEGSHLIAWEHPDMVIGAVARVVARGREAVAVKGEERGAHPRVLLAGDRETVPSNTGAILPWLRGQ
jgi:hypothetical protein